MSIGWRLSSELAYLTGALRALRRVTPIAKDTTRTWADQMDELAKTHGSRPALIDAADGQVMTFNQLAARGNQYSRWAKAQGLTKGDTVALLMHNRLEFMAIWLGLGRMGIVTALLNTNLRDASLAHCINIVGVRAIICDVALADHLDSAMPHIKGRESTSVWSSQGQVDGYQDLDDAVQSQADSALPADDCPQMVSSDPCLYIYTSGTTGLPKAAIINHYRVQATMNGFSAAANASSKDRIYVCLPMYHTVGGVLATGVALTVGGSVVITRKFSVTQFWQDIVRYECTLVEYIGELCRYLLTAPPCPEERQHKVRMFIGNGLRPDIWQAFQDRFRVPRVFEWYAATEGNAVLFNFDGKVGSIGRVPKWLRHRFPIKVVEFDHDMETPKRSASGRCIECPPDQVGEMVSQILNDPNKPSQRFDGYSDREATDTKILRDVFEPGDAWFRTGDLVRRDTSGYFYFVDRIGDTFRWKGENVATTEVAEVLSGFPGVDHVNVYGVSVPHHDGHAGMASLAINDAFNIDKLVQFLTDSLPVYAHPVFLRIDEAMELTGTFKTRKVDLVDQGFDPSRTQVPVYLRSLAETYEPMDQATFQHIQEGKLRV